jgi:outer membrane receptor for ferrienterochelin and colicin
VLGATWTTHGAYVNFAHEYRRGLSVEAGARVSGSTLGGQHALAPWILAAWRFRQDWTIHASAGGSRQFPELDAPLDSRGSVDLVPERATNIDVGIEQRLSSVVWQATIFDRSEQDVLRTAESQASLLPGTALDPSGSAGYQNALDGVARGVELVLKSDSTARVAGWASYTFAIARQTDNGTSETFWSDGDRRHAVNAAGVLHVGPRASLGVVLRAGSGVPMPGYFELRGGQLFVGTHRNDVRLPPYLRLDARVQRTFVSSCGAVTLFAEVVNVLNHRNEGLAARPEPGAGEVTGIARPLLPRRFTVGIEVSFPR